MPTLEERLAYLEGKVGEHSRGFGELRDMVAHLDQKVDRFREELMGAIAATQSRIDALDQRLGGHMEALDQRLGGRMEALDQRLSGRMEVSQDGKVRAVSDLQAYRRRGQEGANPYLQEGDVIFVPPLTGSLVKIFDAATVPLPSPVGEGAAGGGGEGTEPSAPLPLMYELEEGQTFSRLIFDLGGVNPAWDQDHVYVVRGSPGTNAKEKIKVELEKMMIHQDSTKDLVLRKGDSVYFAAASEWPYLNARGELIGVEIPYHQYLYQNKEDGALHRAQRGATSDPVQSLHEVSVNPQTDRAAP